MTTQIALSLCLAGHSVGVLDIDLTGPSIPRFLGIEGSKISQAPGGWIPVPVHDAQALSPLSHANGDGVGDHGSVPTAQSHDRPVGSLHAVSLAFLLASRSSAIVWRGPKKTAMVRQFLSDVLWPPLDYLLIDTPPGTSDEHISVVERLLTLVTNSDPTAPTSVLAGPILAGAVVVTTPQAVSVSDVRKELNFCAKTGVRVVGVVENMSGYVCPCCGVATNIFSKGGGEVMAADFNVPFLGSVPIDAQWGRLVEEGIRPVYAADTELEGRLEKTVEDRDGVRAMNEASKEGLLVDKYRSCSLCPLFKDIAGKVVAAVEASTATSARPPA